MNSREAILTHIRERRAENSREQINSVDAHGYWQDFQVLALLDSLDLSDGRPNWKQEQVDRLHDWCSAHEKKPNTVDGQLSFIGYQLLNTHEGIGRELNRAQSYEQAKEVVEPYIKLLTDEAAQG
jgi:hypothetical protein